MNQAMQVHMQPVVFRLNLGLFDLEVSAEAVGSLLLDLQVLNGLPQAFMFKFCRLKSVSMDTV